MARLKDRWLALWHRLQPEAVPETVLEELIRVYSAPDRFYHNLAHIEHCLFQFDQTKFLAAHPEEVELAIWFHDAVYDTRKETNEQESAAWASEVIDRSGLPAKMAENISASILATRHSSEVRDADAQLMVDLDLSIFGGDTSVFWQYEESIRKEYAWVPESLFRHKRVEILQGFLNRPHIYYHNYYRDTFEEKARLHLRQAITKLSV